MPVFEVTAPDGKTLEINAPEGATQEQVLAYAQQNYKPQAAQQSGFVDKVGERLDKRLTQAAEALTESAQGRQTPTEGALQILGAGAGGIADVMGEAVMAATPDVVKGAIESGARALSENEVVQMGLDALKQGMGKYEEFSAKYPRAARNIESVVNVALIAAPAKAKPVASETAIGKIGEKAVQSGVQKAEKQSRKFVEELITPRQVKKVREAQVKRTFVDRFGTKHVELSPQEVMIADDVARVAGVSPKKTLQANFNAISKANVAEAESLASALKKNPIAFPRKEVYSHLNKARDSLSSNIYIAGDGAVAADKIMMKMRQLVKENPSTASGLLEARKQLDTWIKAQGKGKVFTSQTDDAISIAVREIRRATNDFIDSKATSVGVKESLRRQNNLFSAMDNIAPKAADEAATVIGRIAQRAASKVPLHTQLGQIAGLTGGAATLAALSTVSPFVTNTFVAGLALNKAGKLAMSAQSRKMVGGLLKSVDKAIRLAKTANEKAGFRADRAALVGILKQYDVSPDEVRRDVRELEQ